MATVKFGKCEGIPTIDTDGFGVNRTEVCFELSSSIFLNTRDCANGPTPQLHSVEPSIVSYEYTDYWASEPTGVVFDFGIWIGMELNPDGSAKCLWIGQEEAGVCVSTCNLDADEIQLLMI